MEELFNKTVPVKLKLNGREERQVAIGITIILNIVSSPVQKKELFIRLTDDADPFFLYTLSLGEEDFQGLKVQQKLLVDFAAFPQKLIDLLELCLSEIGKESPRFLVQFCESSNQSVPILHVVETNPFRHLNHLSLKFVTSSDAYLRKYLAECLLKLKEENVSLSHHFTSTKTDLSVQLSQCEQTLHKRTQELECLKSDWSNHSATLTREHCSSLNAEREKNVRAQEEWQARYEKEKRETELAHTERLETVEGRLKELDRSNKELTEHKFRSEAAIRELKAKLKSAEGECDSMREEVRKLRKENSSLDAGTHEKDKSLTQLRTRVAVLEQELRDKEQVMERTSQLLEASQEQKKACEAGLSQRERQVTKLDKAFKSASQEVLKGNEIIQKLQAEIRNVKSTLKMRNKVTTQQEMLLGERERDIDKLKQEVTSLQQSLTQKDGELSKSESVLHETKERLEEVNEQLKTNENVITWLNKQVTEQKIGGHGSRVTIIPPNTFSSSSSIRPSPSTLLHHYGSATSYQGLNSGSSSTLQNKPQFSSTPTSDTVTSYDSSQAPPHYQHHTLSSRNVLGSLGSQENISRQQILFRGLKRGGGGGMGGSHPEHAVKGVAAGTSPIDNKESIAPSASNVPTSSEREPWLDPKYLPQDHNEQGHTPNVCSTITPGVTKPQGILKTSAGGAKKKVDQASRLKPSTLASSYFPKS